MDFIATRVNELLTGYQDGQKLVYRNVLKGSALREFIEILNHCGIKLSYNLRKGGLLVSVRTDKLSNLQNLVNCYKNEQNKENSPDKG